MLIFSTNIILVSSRCMTKAVAHLSSEHQDCARPSVNKLLPRSDFIGELIYIIDPELAQPIVN
jgi:hypothetical protein